MTRGFLSVCLRSQAKLGRNGGEASGLRPPAAALGETACCQPRSTGSSQQAASEKAAPQARGRSPEASPVPSVEQQPSVPSRDCRYAKHGTGCYAPSQIHIQPVEPRYRRFAGLVNFEQGPAGAGLEHLPFRIFVPLAHVRGRAAAEVANLDVFHHIPQRLACDLRVCGREVFHALGVGDQAFGGRGNAFFKAVHQRPQGACFVNAVEIGDQA